MRKANAVVQYGRGDNQNAFSLTAMATTATGTRTTRFPARGRAGAYPAVRHTSIRPTRAVPSAMNLSRDPAVYTGQGRGRLADGLTANLG